MEKTLSVILIIIALIIGVICGAVFTPSEDCEVCEVCPEIPECEVCEICETCEVCEITESCEATPNELLSLAVDEVIDYLDDEDELVCGEDLVEYDRKEVTVRTIYDDFTIEYLDDDEYIVTGSVKLNFKEDDERRCRQTYDFKVLFEEGEDPKVLEPIFE